MKKTRSNDMEFHEQCEIISWKNLMTPTIPELKHLIGSPIGFKLSMSMNMKFKRSGCIVPGWPDLQWPIKRCGFIGLFIELKRGDRKGTVSLVQKKKLKELQTLGHYACVCVGSDEAIETIMRYYNGELTENDLRKSNSKRLRHTTRKNTRICSKKDK